MRNSSRQLKGIVAALLIAGLPALPGWARTAGDNLELAPRAEVTADGFFLSQLFKKSENDSWSKIKLAPAPAWGKKTTLTRTEITELLAKAEPQLQIASITGAAQIEISRRSRPLEEEELLLRLAEKLQPATAAGDRIGELEVRLRQEWRSIQVPVESIDLKILSRPSVLSANFLVRFEIVSGSESIAIEVANVQVRLMQDVWVARSQVRRGTGLEAADFVRDRRDVIQIRDALWTGESLDPVYWVTQPVAAGSVVYARAVEMRPVIFRGQLAQAVVMDDALHISMQVQILEDGAPGQFVRARNIRSRKEIRGKVLNEDTIQVLF
jgi:flagella basal body P-ring formation protein FlgA